MQGSDNVITVIYHPAVPKADGLLGSDHLQLRGDEYFVVKRLVIPFVRIEMPRKVGEAVKERILELCRERDNSINKLCTMSGVTQSTVNNIVSGRNRSVTISTIKKLCDGLDMPIESFFKSDLFKGLEQEIK